MLKRELLKVISVQEAWGSQVCSTSAKGLKECQRAQADPRGAFQAEKTPEQGQPWIYPETRSLEWLAGSGLWTGTAELMAPHGATYKGQTVKSVPPHKVKGCLICFRQELVAWARAVLLKVWSAEPWGSPRPLQCTCGIRAIWTETVDVLCPFCRVDVCTDGPSREPRWRYRSEPALVIFFTATHSV